jgi:sugar phosphate isomerase/epimerase
MFKYTYNTLAFGAEPIADGIARLARFGYDGVEIVGEPSQHDVADIKRHLDHHGMRASSVISIFTPERDIVSSRGHIRDHALGYVKGNIDFAEEIGADVVTFTPTACMKIIAEADLDQEWAWAVDAARDAGAYAKERGVSIAVEPWNRYETYLINRVDQALSFVDDVALDNVGVMIDTFHMGIEESDIAKAIRGVGHRLAHVHLADSNRAAPGTGHLDFEPIIAAIADAQYGGWISYELLPAAGDVWGVLSGGDAPEFLDPYTQASIAHTKAIVDRLGLDR